MVIDGGDRTCVELLLELRGHITQLAPGTVIHLIARDPAALRTSAAYCQTQPHSPWRLTDDAQGPCRCPGGDAAGPGPG